MKVYEHYFGLKFQVTGNNLTVESTNNLIKKFREKLDNFKMEKGSLKASVIYPTDIVFEGANQIHNSLVEGNYSHIRMNICDDVGEPLATKRFNNTVRAEISQGLMAIEIEYYNTALRVVKVGYH